MWGGEGGSRGRGGVAGERVQERGGRGGCVGSDTAWARVAGVEEDGWAWARQGEDEGGYGCGAERGAGSGAPSDGEVRGGEASAASAACRGKEIMGVLDYG